MPRFLLFLLSFPVLLPGQEAVSSHFVAVSGGQFTLNAQPYQYVGTNYWYAPFVAADAQGRERIVRELDVLAEAGIANLRLMASGEGPAREPRRITPTLRESPEAWNEDIASGLDFVLAEMGKRQMKAVLCLNNFFYWSGGMAQYVSWFTGDPIPYPEENGWEAYMAYSARFYGIKPAVQAYRQLISRLVTRRNSITGQLYRDDPTIMAWQLANEPREFGHDKKYFRWVKRSLALIHQLDSRHLRCIGNEGILDSRVGSTYARTASLPHLDYLTVHLWPENWGWYDPLRPDTTYPQAQKRAMAFLNANAEVAVEAGKPIVLEEFGLARDEGSCEARTPVSWRDRFYQFLHAYTLGTPTSPYQGLNFWAMGGEGSPRQAGQAWQPGDVYTGDPPHEKQGWYSVYFSDSTTMNWLQSLKKRL